MCNQSNENLNILLIVLCFFLAIIVYHFLSRTAFNTLCTIGFVIWLIYKWLCNRNNKN